MSVELDPVELGFRRPFTQEVAETLRLKNPNSDPVAFKVKTTAPKQYCVRPNSGRIEAGNVVEVQVLLQAMKEDPPPDAKCRDKFLVQSVAVSADSDFSNIQAIWSNMEKNAKSSIQEKKIRVSFLPADGSVSTPSKPATSTATNQDDHQPVYSSPVSQAAATPNQRSVTEDTPSYSDSAPNSGTAAAVATGAGAGAGLGVGAAFAGVANKIPTSQEELSQQLEEAKATIARLTKQVQEQGLRQRKTDAVSSDSKERATGGVAGQSVQQAIPNGVPVPIVAALCLLSFLLAYLLF